MTSRQYWMLTDCLHTLSLSLLTDHLSQPNPCLVKDVVVSGKPYSAIACRQARCVCGLLVCTRGAALDSGVVEPIHTAAFVVLSLS